MLDSVDADMRAEIAAALDDRTVFGTDISRALAEAEIASIKPDTIQRHRKGECVCG